VRLLPYGSRAVLVELGSLEEVVGLHRALDAERPAGVVDLVPAARTLLITVDPDRTTPAAVERAVRAVDVRAQAPAGGALVEVPVTYDGADLDEVAAGLGVTPAELVARHAARPWTVAFCGFLPGFGYLVQPGGGWAVPRRATPRTAVPAGSVALAGEFSGVYPAASPGGWQLIGRTALDVFDLDRDPPALLAPGARVRFVPA
jgi:KipI family sensor histidine kinase inhibitor